MKRKARIRSPLLGKTEILFTEMGNKRKVRFWKEDIFPSKTVCHTWAESKRRCLRGGRMHEYRPVIWADVKWLWKSLASVGTELLVVVKNHPARVRRVKTESRGRPSGIPVCHCPPEDRLAEETKAAPLES